MGKKKKDKYGKINVKKIFGFVWFYYVKFSFVVFIILFISSFIVIGEIVYKLNTMKLTKEEIVKKIQKEKENNNFKKDRFDYVLKNVEIREKKNSNFYTINSNMFGSSDLYLKSMENKNK